jgi:hippurate hydrolase
MAATDTIEIVIEGRGAHAARPHLGVDAVVTGAQIVINAQSIVSRNIDPLKSGVVSICVFRAGHADNVLPDTVTLRGTARSFDPDIRKLIETRLREVVEGVAMAQGARATLNLMRGYPVLRNHEAETEFARSVAQSVAGADRVDPDLPPMMGGEDFSYMLNARPGAFIFVGNGEDSAGLHHPRYNFNDDVIPYGTSYWVKLVETAQPA